MKRMFIATTIAAVFAMATSHALAVDYYEAGHGDIGMGEGDTLKLHLHLHGGSAIVNGTTLTDDHGYIPGEEEAVILVPAAAETVIPSGTTWEALGGAADDPVWILPQSNTPGMPFLGFGAEELSDDTFSDAITLSLDSVSGSGVDNGGYFSMWQSSIFDTTFYMSTANGIDETDVYEVQVGAHDHANWGFTAPGEYHVTFTATGAGQTDTGTFTFNVVPEPSSFALAGLGLIGIVGLAVRRRFRKG